MNRKDWIVLTLGMSTLVVACVWMYLWYNNDRYQYVHYQQGTHGNVRTVIFDKNKGVEYDSGLRIDYPSAKTTKREFKIIEDQ